MASKALPNFLALLFPIISAVFFLPYYPELQMEGFSSNETRKFEGPLAPNEALDAAKTIGADVLIGPENFEFFEGYIYTGTTDGKIYRIKQKQIENILDWKCNIKEGEINNCSRPLGLRIDKRTKQLYVADSVKGLYKYNLQSGDIQTLFDASQPINGNFSRLTDDLVVTKTGDIYFTDASIKWSFDELMLDIIEFSGNGRILHYNPETNTTKLLLDHLYFANGIQLSPNEDFFIFAESTRYRILRYYLKGPKKGTVDVFVDNLPGFPDNIRASGRGTYWVALAKARLESNTLADTLTSYPTTRYFILRLLYLFALPVGVLDYLKITENALSYTRLKLLLIIDMLAPKYGLVLELDAKGDIIRSLHSPTGNVGDISTATEHDGVLYIGSPWRNGIRVLPLS